MRRDFRETKHAVCGRRYYLQTTNTPRRAAGSIPPKDPLPWLNDGTTYRNDYTPKGLMLLPPAGYDPASPFPFDATTEYRWARTRLVARLLAAP